MRPYIRVYKTLSKVSKSLSKQVDKELNTSSTRNSSNRENIFIYRVCWKDNPVTSEHCSACQTQIRIPPSNIMKVCQKRGLAVNDGSIYCFRCGTKI